MRAAIAARGRAHREQRFLVGEQLEDLVGPRGAVSARGACGRRLPARGRANMMRANLRARVTRCYALGVAEGARTAMQSGRKL